MVCSHSAEGGEPREPGRGPGEAGARAAACGVTAVWAGVPDARCAPRTACSPATVRRARIVCVRPCPPTSGPAARGVLLSDWRDGVCSECPAADARQIPPEPGAGVEEHRAHGPRTLPGGHRGRGVPAAWPGVATSCTHSKAHGHLPQVTRLPLQHQHVPAHLLGPGATRTPPAASASSS